MSRKNDVIYLPLIFPNSSAFRQLQAATNDDGPTLLGRVVSVAIAVASQSRASFGLAELDAVAAWRPRPETFGEMLEKVGWARSDLKAGSVEVALPEALQNVNKRRDAGVVRARGAARDGAGRYLPTGSPQKTRPRVVVDTDGKAVP